MVQTDRARSDSFAAIAKSTMFNATAAKVQRLSRFGVTREGVRAEPNCVVERGWLEEETSHWLWRSSISDRWDRERMPKAW